MIRVLNSHFGHPCFDPKYRRGNCGISLFLLIDYTSVGIGLNYQPSTLAFPLVTFTSLSPQNEIPLLIIK